MNEQHVPANIRILNAIDQDIEDAKITLGLIEKLTEENSNTHSNIFNLCSESFAFSSPIVIT